MVAAVDEQVIRAEAQGFCDALAGGDIDQAIDALSLELRRNAGEVLGLLPLPANDVTIESLERSGSGFNVVIRLIGETDEDLVQTRWKDRDGRPTVVEVSHLSRTERAEPLEDEQGGSPEDVA